MHTQYSAQKHRTQTAKQFSDNPMLKQRWSGGQVWFQSAVPSLRQNAQFGDSDERLRRKIENNINKMQNTFFGLGHGNK
jgi:hypothetical protein